MTRRKRIILIVTAALCGALVLTAVRAHDAPRVATGFISRTLCSAAFVSGVNPDQVFSETADAMPGVRLITWAIDYRVDRKARQVTTTLFWGGMSRAVYREGLGCYLAHGEDSVDVSLPAAGEIQRASLPEISGPSLIAAANPELALALDRAFAEPDQPPFRRTKAVVVVKDGRLIAERYASGYGVDTPIIGYSATKSVISALTGILVRQGKLAVDRPAPLAAWRNPDDPRHAITIDQLLRHTSGLAMGSSLNASLASTLAPVNKMKYVESDQAGFAESAALESAPGSAWNYHDGNFVILSRLIRDAVGGHAADVLRFARGELFGPLGMRNVTLEFDATGTPEGASQMLAPARDWARFGLLYLNDGVAGGKRILPEGWVDYSASPTPNGWVGYGAGFWTNRGASLGATYRIEQGWPRDAFLAKGTLGQYVIVIPSERLVIVRLGISPNSPLGADGVSRLVRDVVAATHEARAVAGD
ncbi:MAG TPA: serine hydrolase [Xanthobacteraceae bacterium]|nr:serine hydrolase [Xanthobacteraceae bacterium]